MNKKFSTLVASLLLTSAFSVYSVDAKPMLATPTQVETRAAAADVEEAVEVGTAALPTYPTTLDGKVLPGFTNYAQIVTVATLGSSETTEQYVGVNASGDVVRTQNGYNNLNDAPNYYWQLINGRLVTNSNIEFSLSGLDEYIEIVPIVKDGKATEFFAIAKRDNDGNLQYVEFTSPNVLGWSAYKAQDPETNIGRALLFMSVETEYNTPISAADMNKVLDDGFMLSIASKIDEDAAIVDENVFEGVKITADETQSPYYQLKKDGKVIFIGDGINDSPVLATSDFGIAMGEGTDIASTTADSILISNSISTLPQIINTARKTLRIVNENITISLLAKLIVLILGILGIAPVWLAVGADTGITLLTVVNSIRIFNK